MRRHNSFRTPRRKKIRNPIRIKERVAKKGGRCSACRGRYEKGDEVTVVNIRRRTFHRHGCVPLNVGQMPTAGGGVQVGSTPADVIAAMRSNWTVGEAKLVAIQAMENAMVVIAKNNAIVEKDVDPNKAFDKYKKYKTVFLRPGSDNEGRQGARLAIIEVVKTFF